jgi:hypothetical protein
MKSLISALGTVTRTDENGMDIRFGKKPSLLPFRETETMRNAVNVNVNVN